MPGERHKKKNLCFLCRNQREGKEKGALKEHRGEEITKPRTRRYAWGEGGEQGRGKEIVCFSPDVKPKEGENQN